MHLSPPPVAYAAVCSKVVVLVALTVFLMSCDSQCSVALPHSAVGCLQCMIVVLPFCKQYVPR